MVYRQSAKRKDTIFKYSMSKLQIQEEKASGHPVKITERFALNMILGQNPGLAASIVWS
jgi:hypothetical protein